MYYTRIRCTASPRVHHLDSVPVYPYQVLSLSSGVLLLVGSALLAFNLMIMLGVDTVPTLVLLGEQVHSP